MPTRLVATRIEPDEIREKDEITFDYANPNCHPQQRVGLVVGFKGKYESRNRCVLLWDYSLNDGPAYHSYRLDKLRFLSRLDRVNREGRLLDSISKFKEAIKNFRRMFGRGEQR